MRQRLLSTLPHPLGIRLCIHLRRLKLRVSETRLHLRNRHAARSKSVVATACRRRGGYPRLVFCACSAVGMVNFTQNAATSPAWEDCPDASGFETPCSIAQVSMWFDMRQTTVQSEIARIPGASQRCFVKLTMPPGCLESARCRTPFLRPPWQALRGGRSLSEGTR